MATKKILIIDDVPDLADSIDDMLQFKGYHTMIARSGREGLTAALLEHPDLILLDLRMPDIDGYEVIRRLRKDAWGKHAKILILTAADTSEAIPEDIAVTPDEILHKSQWGIDNIAARVDIMLAE